MSIEIPKAKELEQKVFTIKNEQQFLQIALQLFNFQYLNNSVYLEFCKAIHCDPGKVNSLEEIPFLPISFFKTHKVKTTDFEPEVVFKSSGTTGSLTSKHFVKDTEIYKRSFSETFNRTFGDVSKFCVLGLLPSYLEQENSSLVFMVDELITNSGHSSSGFYLYDFESLHQSLLELETACQPTILFGVTYALIDFAEKYSMPLKHTIIIETGGMKGRKKEFSKVELYHLLQKSFSVNSIYSEYGMTELLSQSYGENGLFTTPPWKKIILRDETDPFAFGVNRGAVNVIDLANIYSCSFIATDDLAKQNDNGSFEILGRMDNSDIRGCSQLFS